MSYIKADEVLPQNIIAIIQQYIDGESIYIPKRNNERAEWGKKSGIKQELQTRNRSIFNDYLLGVSTLNLADKYCLSDKSIQRIIRDMKNQNQESVH